jgi:hypothetical protein
LAADVVFVFRQTRGGKKMKQLRFRSIAALILGAIVAVVAYAGNVHLKGGNNAEPQFTDLGLRLEAEGALAGLGNGDVLVTLNATADVTAVCQNNGGHQAPGQNPAPITVTGSVAIPAPEVQNGNTPFAVTTLAPESPIEGAPDCPNPGWDEIIIDLAFTSATITVEQPAENTVLVVECTFSPPTSNGPVKKQDVDCS